MFDFKVKKGKEQTIAKRATKNAQRTNKDGSICLHARKISFKHPTKEEKICLEASVPKEDIWKNI